LRFEAVFISDVLKADFLIVQVCDFLEVGDGVYRFHTPSRALAAGRGGPAPPRWLWSRPPAF